MSKGTALIKSRDRYRKLITAFPERCDFYLEKLADVENEITTMQVCRHCGRPLRSEEAIKAGYGKECQAQIQAARQVDLPDGAASNQSD